MRRTLARGLDSLAAVQLRNTLQRQTSLALPSAPQHFAPLEI